MRVDVLTLFPAAFAGPLDVSIIARARAQGLLSVHLTDIREFASDRHRTVDDYPYGGGPGMVMRADVLDAALEYVKRLEPAPAHVVAMTPQGRLLDDGRVRALAGKPRVAIVCGRYEGMDERFLEHRVDEEISIGDYIVTGGELPAMVLIDAVARHLPGVLGDEASPADESFADGLLEHPQYTRPASWHGWKVPEVLVHGDHAEIDRWRGEQRVLRTRERRPDLLARAEPPPARARERRSRARVHVRPANLATDLKAIRETWDEAGEGMACGVADAVEELAGLDRELFLVAEARQGVVGTVIGGFDGRRGYAYHLAVRKRFRGRGVAEALMTELSDRLRTRGCQRMKVHVVPGNWPAMRFYEREGWARTSLHVYARNL